MDVVVVVVAVIILNMFWTMHPFHSMSECHSFLSFREFLTQKVHSKENILKIAHSLLDYFHSGNDRITSAKRSTFKQSECANLWSQFPLKPWNSSRGTSSALRSLHQKNGDQPHEKWADEAQRDGQETQPSSVSLSGHRHVSAVQAGASVGRHWRLATDVQGSATSADVVPQAVL